MGTGTLTGAAPRFAGGLRELAPGVWAWVQPNGSWGEANAGLVAGDGASLVVDTLWDEALAAEMLAAMAPHTAGSPARLVVNTHSDGDHWWGNSLLPDEAQIVTSAASREAMAHESPPLLARMARLAAAGARLPGRLGETPRYVHGMLAPFDFDGVTPRIPDRTFSGSLELDVGGRAVKLVEVGPAHTAGDLVVHVPDAAVVFAADVLFVGSTPVMWAGLVSNWLDALDTLLALDAEVYVPGHGPPCGVGEVRDLADYWRCLDAAVAQQLQRGASAGEAARALARDPELARWRSWDCPERVVISVATIYRNHTGDAGPVSSITRARLFGQVAALARELA